MKKLFTLLFLFVGITAAVSAQESNSFWQRMTSAPLSQTTPRIKAKSFIEYNLNSAAMLNALSGLSTDPNAGQVIQLPMPNGQMRSFKVWRCYAMEAPLAAKFPEIQTFSAYALDDHSATAKLDFTSFGFHAMIYDGDNTSFIDPYSFQNDGHYMVHYKRDEFRPAYARMACNLGSNNHLGNANNLLQVGGSSLPALDNQNSGNTAHNAQKLQNGHQLRTYRLALSADHFYCQAATGTTTPTMAQCISAMTTTMNRVNGVYEREFSGMMVMVANDTAIVWPLATGNTSGNDPYTAAIDANSNQCLTTNQTQCDTKIGTANYDYGHVFTTGGGGLSGQGIVCVAGQKAQTVTGSPTPTGDGFDIDYVAHEMGHAWGAGHTFNDGTNGSCGGGNRVANMAYEPASATTIMGYAGICAPDDIQPHSDAYFHRASINQIITYMTTSTGNTCAAFSNTGNLYVTMAAFSASYSIPTLTPFELTSPAVVDSAADTANRYCWEENDLGSAFDFSTGTPTNAQGPTFKSFSPSLSTTRVFPIIDTVLKGVTTYMGEKLPNAARTLKFKLTTRSYINGFGSVTIPDDSISINEIPVGPFTVTAPAAAVSWGSGTTQTVTWNVANTNNVPISAANVDIYMSVDGGYTWPYTVGTFPNNGTASITVPTIATTTSLARIKVKGNGNVFFNVNVGNFTVTASSGTISAGGPTTFCTGGSVLLTASPATGATYQWQKNGVNVVPANTTDTLTVTQSGTYTCIINSAVSNSIVVTVNTSPTATVTPAGPASFCSTGTFTLTANSGSGLTYKWLLNNGNINGATSVTYAANQAGNYNCIVTNVSTCSATSNTVLLTTTPAPTATITTPNGTSLCGVANLPLNANVGGGLTYQWQLNGANINGATAATYNATLPGVYDVIVSQAGCSTTSSTVTLTATTPTPSITAPNGTSLCGSSVLLQATSGVGITYQWQLNGANINGATAATYTANLIGNYTVIETQGTCSSSTSAATSVTANLPTPVVSTPNGTTLCGSNSVLLTTPVVGGYSYQWMLNGVNINGATTATYPATTIGNYSVHVVSGSCNATSAVTSITASSVPTAIIVPTAPITFCDGGQVLLTTNTTPTNLLFQWQLNGVDIPGATDSTYLATQGGVYTVVLSITGCGSATSFPITVSVLNNPIPVITQNGSILSTTTGYSSYQWYLNGTAIPGANSNTYTMTQNGTYSVVVTNPNTCSRSSALLNVGTTGISTTIGNNDKIRIFPNPTRSVVYIEYHTMVDISIQDITGRTLIIEKDTKLVDMSGLSSGMYMIYVRDNSGNLLQIEKIVKQ